jgi:hypothetical protein
MGPGGLPGCSRLWALHVFKQWLDLRGICGLRFKRVVFPLVRGPPVAVLDSHRVPHAWMA